MPDQPSPSEMNEVPSERDPDYSALVPGAEASAARSAGSNAGNTGPGVPDPSLADTSGTGTIVALGCIGATAFLIVIGLVYLVITQLVG